MKKIIGIFLGAAIVVGPIIINMLYKIPGSSFFVTEWTAGDMLQYYGMIVTAFIAIGGLYLTFQDNRKGIREQGRLDKLPNFSMTTLNYHVRNPLFDTTVDKEIDSKGETILKPSRATEEYYYKEEELRAAVIGIKNGNAFIKTKLSENEKRLILNGGVAEQKLAVGVMGFVNKPMTYVPIVLKNVGNGVALDFRIGFNRLTNEKLDNPKYLSSLSLDIGEEFYLGFFSVHEKDENSGEYLFEIKYRDVFNNQYKQSTKFIVKWENNAVETNVGVEFAQELTKRA